MNSTTCGYFPNQTREFNWAIKSGLRTWGGGQGQAHDAPGERLVPEAGGLLQREEHAADRRAERGRNARRRAAHHEVALVRVAAEHLERAQLEPTQRKSRRAPLRNARAHRSAHVNHRALLQHTHIHTHTHTHTYIHTYI